MSSAAAFILLILLAAAMVALYRLWQRQRTLQVDDAELAVWLDADLPWRRCLDAARKRKHVQQVRDLLSRARFYGCQGQVVDERTAVVIAGLACLLTLRHERRAYPHLRAVLVYPAAFWVPQDQPDEAGLVSDEEILHMGMSQEIGRVILSWEDIEAALAGDTTNVAVHEFAHQLDDLGGGDGAPAGADAERWPRVMQSAWNDFERDSSPVLDDYGLEGPAEFFAVAVEAFFQQPDALHAAHPALHDLLCDTFGVDFRGVTFSRRRQPLGSDTSRR